jgi:iron complex transport system permease protein
MMRNGGVIENRTAFVLAFLAMTGAVFIAVSTGRYPIHFSTLGDLIFSFLGLKEADSLLDQPALVLWSVRMPRILMAVMTGAGLSVSGTLLQGVFRNPLVSPRIMGVTSGAGFGAALALLLGAPAVVIEASAFVWGLIAVSVAYMIGKRGSHQVTSLILAGIIVTAMSQAGLSYIKCKADPLGQLPAIVYWTMGSFNGVSWGDVACGGSLILIGLILSYFLRWGLNPMALGEEEAMSLGINVTRRRAGYILIAILMVAASTAACGEIGWAGLIVPHIARMIVGADNDILVPYSALLGGIFMLCMDTLARTLPGGEVPVGILTDITGAACFGILLIRNRRKVWN